ncbi:uncharacterized protein [Branchiostoma lanceolatum]|uniref:uncharacterized protein n=1 Tax=Branchiostoma lanceolatum TaxID=7740 RepID=UPI003452B238
MADLQEHYVEYDQAKSSQCGLCLQVAERPRALPCLHAFCDGCLREYAHGKRRLKCPLCRERVKLPSEGVSALPDNNGVRSHTKKLTDYAQITTSEDNVRGEGTQKCVHHPWEDLRLVCQHCHVPVCLQCLDEMHEGHSAVSFKRVSRRRKITVRKLVTEGNRTLDDYYTTLQSLQDTQNTLDESKKQTEEDVHARYDDVLRGLAEERAMLLFDIEDNHTRTSSDIEAQRKSLSSRVSDLNDAINSAEKGMERGVRESDVLLQVLDKCKETPPLPDPPVQAQLPVFMPEESYSRVLGHLTWQPLTANKATEDLEEKDHLSPNNGTYLETNIDPSDRKTPESHYPSKGQEQKPEYVNLSSDLLQGPSLRSPSAVESNKRVEYSSPLPEGSPNLGRTGYNVNGLGAGKPIASPVTKVSHRAGLTENTRVREPIVGSIQELRDFRREQDHVNSSRESPFSTDHSRSSMGVTQNDQTRNNNNVSLGQESPRIPTGMQAAQQTSRPADMRLSPPEHSPRLSSGSDIPDDGFYRHHKPEQPNYPNRRHRMSSDSDNVDHGVMGRHVNAVSTQAQPSRTTPTYKETSSEDGTHVEYSSGFYRVVRGKKKRTKSSGSTGNDVRYDRREPSPHLQETGDQNFDNRNVSHANISRHEEQVMPRTPTPSRQHSERRHGGPQLDDASPRSADELQAQDEIDDRWPEVVPKHIEDEVLKEIARMSQSSRESEQSDNSEPRRRKQVVEAEIQQDGTTMTHKDNEEITDVPNLPSYSKTTNTDIEPHEDKDVRSDGQYVTIEEVMHHGYANPVIGRNKQIESPKVARPQEQGRSSTYSDEDPHSPASPDSDVFTPKYTGDNTENPTDLFNAENKTTKDIPSDDDGHVSHVEVPRRIGPNKRGLSFGGEGSEVGKFSGPSGVFVIADEIYVADQDNNRVQAFSMQGECLGELPTVVTGSPQSPTNKSATKAKAVPMEPHDVAVDTNDNIWVVGSDGMTSDFILRYDMEGRPLTKIDLPFTGYWRGIAVHSHRKFIVVSEPFGGEVKLFAPPRGTLIRTLGGESGLKAPWYVAVDNDGKIYVSDWSGHYIYVFQDNGKMLLRFGGEGSDEGQLQCPCGICVDNAGNIIVADSLNQRVEMFDKAGTFLKHIATDLQGPQAVAMVKDGTIVVTETDKNSVSIYHY